MRHEYVIYYRILGFMSKILDSYEHNTNHVLHFLLLKIKFTIKGCDGRGVFSAKITMHVDP